MRTAILVALALTLAAPAMAQKPATYPAETAVRKVGDRTVFVNRKGRTLYALDARVAYTRTAGQAVICSDACAQQWIPLAAPADAKPVGDWSVVTKGTSGPQWAWRSRPVFTRVADKGPGDLSGDGAEDIWTAIDYVPPAPELAAPAMVKPLFRDGHYLLADTDGHALFVVTGKETPGAWTPLFAGMAAQGVGDWTVLQGGERAQWAWRGKPVFVSNDAATSDIPAGTNLLHP